MNAADHHVFAPLTCDIEFLLGQSSLVEHDGNDDEVECTMEWDREKPENFQDENSKSINLATFCSISLILQNRK